MNLSSKRLRTIRDELREAINGTLGLESVSITRDDNGELALAVHIDDAFFDQSTVPKNFGGLRVLKRKASRFLPH